MTKEEIERVAEDYADAVSREYNHLSDVETALLVMNNELEGAFGEGVKWAAERMFTSKDLEHAFHGGMASYVCFSDWYMENKKKCNHERFYMAEDMAEFAEWFSANWDLDFKADSALEIWLKERKSNGSL